MCTASARSTAPTPVAGSSPWRTAAAVTLLGNREHPYTRGALCEKVNRYLEHTRQPDRLLWPMRRTGKKGEGRFARISWDEALGEIAARWRAIIERDGPQAIWPYYGTGTLGMIQGLAGAGRRLWNVLGTTQHHLSICMSAGGFATGYTLGDNRIGMDPEGIADAAARHPLGRQSARHAPSHLEVRGGRPPQGRARGRDRSGPHAQRGSGRRASGAEAGHRCGAGARTAARGGRPGRRGPRVHRGAHARLGRLPRAHPGLSPCPRRRDHGTARRAHRGPRRAAGHGAPHGDPDRPRACSGMPAGAWRCGRSRASRASPETGATRAAARPTTRGASSRGTGPRSGATISGRPARACSR